MISRKHIWIIVLFILLGVAAFVLAGRSNAGEKNEVSLYFLDKNSYVITPNRRFDVDSGTNANGVLERNVCLFAERQVL